jgi:hypothetical protein
MWYKFIFVKLGLFFALNAVGAFESAKKKELIFLGGWTKTPDEITFDKSVEPAGDFFSDNPDYHKDIFFGGSSVQLMNLTEKSFNDVVRSFSPDNYNRFEQKLLDKKDPYFGQFKAGDQILIVMDNHGSPKQSFFEKNQNGMLELKPEETHSVSWGLKSVYKPTNSYSLDRLRSVIEEFKKRGVKVAIIDSSCYSGTTQSLAKHGACVISATGPNNLSFPDFKMHLFQKFKKGKNLEQVFLEARAETKSPSIPEISTDIGKTVSSQFTEFWLSSRVHTEEDLTERMIPYTHPSNIEKCRDWHTSNEEHLVESIGTILGILPDQIPSTRKFSKAVKEYDDAYQTAIEGLRKEMEFNAFNEEPFEWLYYPNVDKPAQGIIINVKPTWLNIANVDSESTLKELKHYVNSIADDEKRFKFLLGKWTEKHPNQPFPENNPNANSSTPHQIDPEEDDIRSAKLALNRNKSYLTYFEKLREKKAELLSNTKENSPHFQTAKEFRHFLKVKDKYDKIVNKDMKELTKNVIAEERKAFDEIYRAMQSSNKSDKIDSNPCREFEL